MPIPFLPIAVLSLCGVAIIKKTSQKETANQERKTFMNGERKAIYESALRSLREPEKLLILAAKFEGEGLKNEGWALRQRARLRALPTETKQARRRAFKSAMASTNPEAVERMAQAFEQDFCFDAATKLREYAKELNNVQAQQAQNTNDTAGTASAESTGT